MHHGYYVPENRTDHVQAQVDLIDEVLKWAGVESPKSVVDVGCGKILRFEATLYMKYRPLSLFFLFLSEKGIGGSSRHIAKKYDCQAQGITLSPYQANRGNELAQQQGLAGQTTFQVCKCIKCIIRTFMQWTAR